MAFIGLPNVYDLVPRSKLWNAMQKLEIQKELIETTRKPLQKNKVFVTMGTGIIEKFNTTKGLTRLFRVSNIV